MTLTRRLLLLLLVAALLAGAAWLLWGPLELQGRLRSETLDDLVVRAGAWGPALVIGLMTVAIVMTPIPSAPIAMAAGAAYGHVWGTIYVILGAELGAVLAFALARVLGRDVMRRWLGDRIEAGLLGSQNALMATVLVSRLLPFVSFDLISYAAGLSVLHAWRFAVATFAGIVPASFLLAHFGMTAVRGDGTAAVWAALAIGAFTGAPLIWAAVRSTRRR